MSPICYLDKWDTIRIFLNTIIYNCMSMNVPRYFILLTVFGSLKPFLKLIFIRRCYLRLHIYIYYKSHSIRHLNPRSLSLYALCAQNCLPSRSFETCMPNICRMLIPEWNGANTHIYTESREKCTQNTNRAWCIKKVSELMRAGHKQKL